MLKYSEREGIKDLGYKLKDGDTRYNKGKNAEVENRVRHFDIEVGESCGC